MSATGYGKQEKLVLPSWGTTTATLKLKGRNAGTYDTKIHVSRDSTGIPEELVDASVSITEMSQ